MLHRLCGFAMYYRSQTYAPNCQFNSNCCSYMKYTFSLKTNPTKHINSLFPVLPYLGSIATTNNAKTEMRQFCIESI